MTLGTARAAWTSLLVVPVVGALLAVKGLITGAPSNPALVTTLTGLDWQRLSTEQPGVTQLLGVLKRHESLAMLAWSFWLAWTNVHAACAARAARWVWYGWWTVPAVTLGIMATGAGARGMMSWTVPVLTAFTVVALGISRPLFFSSGTIVRAAVVVVLVLATACAGQQPRPELAGTRWRLVEFQSSDDAIGTVKPDSGDIYTMALEIGGQASLQLDCNRASATWTATPAGESSGSFQFGPIAMTMAFCPQPSLDAHFGRHAPYVRSYLLKDSRLYLNLMADGGTYVWEATQR